MNLVREHINFERGLEPKEAMKIGSFKKIKKGDVFLIKDPYIFVAKKDKMQLAIANNDEEENTIISRELCKRFVPVEIYGKDWFVTFDEDEKCWKLGKPSSWEKYK